MSPRGPRRLERLAPAFPRPQQDLAPNPFNVILQRPPLPVPVLGLAALSTPTRTRSSPCRWQPVRELPARWPPRSRRPGGLQRRRAVPLEVGIVSQGEPISASPEPESRQRQGSGAGVWQRGEEEGAAGRRDPGPGRRARARTLAAPGSARTARTGSRRTPRIKRAPSSRGEAPA